jgi:D-glycero-D-manno-heptose 1,7-bisphosphate phosphatase
MANKAVFLDRDGVLVVPDFRDGRSFAVTSLEEFVYFPGVKKRLARLKAAGFKLFVVTNQPDVNAGKISRAIVEAMHDRMRADLPLDGLKACYHTKDEQPQCQCRKPRPGMLLELIREHDIDPALSFMVGDRDSDVVAGRAAGCRPVFIDLNYDRDLERLPDGGDVAIVRSLEEAVNAILDADKRNKRS